MQIVSDANCDLLDNVQLISDKLWVERRDLIAGKLPAKAVRCMPALANGATVNLWGVPRASVGEYLQCELLTDEDIAVYCCIAYHPDCMHAVRCTAMHPLSYLNSYIHDQLSVSNPSPYALYFRTACLNPHPLCLSLIHI